MESKSSGGFILSPGEVTGELLRRKTHRAPSEGLREEHKILVRFTAKRAWDRGVTDDDVIAKQFLRSVGVSEESMSLALESWRVAIYEEISNARQRS